MAELCLNLCEVLNASMLKEERLERIISLVMRRNAAEEPLTRIYAGSSFCSQYFLHINWWEPLLASCREHRWKMTLTLPVFSQKDLKKGKERIGDILVSGADVIDEITVNDVGMLLYISGECTRKINLGRLFFKDARDVRVRDYDEGIMTPNLLTSRDSLPADWSRIHGIELDRMSREIDLTDCPLEGMILGLHGPFCYMSTGNICKFASIHKKTEYKFRPNTPCAMECAGIYEHYRARFDGRDTDVIRFGRTIYYLKNDSRVIGKTVDRTIYFPVREAGEVMRGGDRNESTGSAQ